ncbi:hypothetical protein BUC_5630 [Burkholderia pseudomallei 576]|nr:hypothetical protein BUC_5630 [Burkholderia pseudomallei 576]
MKLEVGANRTRRIVWSGCLTSPPDSESARGAVVARDAPPPARIAASAAPAAARDAPIQYRPRSNG